MNPRTPGWRQEGREKQGEHASKVIPPIPHQTPWFPESCGTCTPTSLEC